MAMYRDRADAGRRLARRLESYAGRPDVRVLGLPRGGVPVAFEVAQALDAPVDVFLVRKLGVPGHEELGMGAIATGGVRFLNEEVVAAAGVSEEQLEAVARREQAELERRERLYRGDRRPLEVAGRTALLVDDGLATGSTMRAAVEALRRQRAERIVVAVPVGSGLACAALEQEVDELVCASTPEPFVAISLWYDVFSQVTDDEVRELLERARGRSPGMGAHA